MREYLELGQAPAGEACAQVGDPDYRVKAIRECQTYIQAIRNYLGPEPEGALLSYKAFPHDFGSYYEVVCHYDESKPESVEYAYRCEKEAPLTWADGGVKPPGRTAATRRSR